MGDSDESYDFSALTPSIDKLRQGYYLVMGNRFGGGIAPGAMPPMHEYVGLPEVTAFEKLMPPRRKEPIRIFTRVESDLLLLFINMSYRW